MLRSPEPFIPSAPAQAAARGDVRSTRLRRLRQMKLPEIAGRTRQEASKWWDRVAGVRAGCRPVIPPSERVLRLEAFREAVPGRFFAGTEDARTPTFLATLIPDAARELVAQADRSLDGRFDLLGYRDLFHGTPIDWHLDSVSGVRAPLLHWSCLDLFDTAAVGDYKVVWELNRHQWMVELGQAYQITGDERYARAFVTQVTSWLESNPPGRGINWASSLEVALRLMAWCWALRLFRLSPALEPEWFARTLASIAVHARHVERYLSHYFSPNTHLTGEALGLLYAGTLFPELPAARRWRETGGRILARAMSRQVLPDGVYFEQSTCYQRYTAEIALHFLLLCSRGGLQAPAGLGARVQAMLDFLLAVRSPGGEAPQIGDSDGGWLLPLARRRPQDLRGLFGPAAALFGRPDYAWAAGGLVPEVLWLLGPAGLSAFESIRPAPPDTPCSRVFPEGGYAVMRDGWELDAHHLVFDVGSLGCPVSAAHGHADLLSVQCSAFGEPLLVDPGTGVYANESWRSFFRSSAAHSTVTVDGESQAAPAGRFAWQQRPSARLTRWVSVEAFDFADAEHDGYVRLSDPVRHRRRVLFVKPRYWVLVDDLEGDGRHHVEVRFQFGPVEVGLERDLWARAWGARRGLLVRPFSTVPLEGSVRRGASQPMEGWASPDYGQFQPAPALVYSAEASLPLRVVTLLLPCANPAAPPPIVRARVGAGSGPMELVFEPEGDTVSFDGRGVHLRPGPAAITS